MTGRDAGQPIVCHQATGDGFFREGVGPLAVSDNGTNQVVCFDVHQATCPGNRSNPQPGDPCHTLPISSEAPVVAIAFQGGAQQDQIVPRRLTPTECERLQGFPDDWTAWGVDERGKRKDMADGPRYRFCGNAVTVSVVQWLAERIMGGSRIHVSP